jgi:hypothetical protein
MQEYIYNRRSKTPELLKSITRSLAKDRKETQFSEEEQANEVGYKANTMRCYLKPSHTDDMQLHTFISILEMTGDLTPLDVLEKHFDRHAVPNRLEEVKTKDINILCDVHMIQSSDLFKQTKKALEDGKITKEEQIDMLKEIDQEEQALAELKAAVFNAFIEE